MPYTPFSINSCNQWINNLSDLSSKEDERVCVKVRNGNKDSATSRSVAPTTTLHFSKNLAFKSHFEVVCLGCRFNRSGGPSLDVCYGWTIIAQSAEPTTWSQSQKNTRPESLLPSLKHIEFCAEAVYQHIWNDFLHFSCNTDALLACVFKTFECFLATPQQKREQLTV